MQDYEKLTVFHRADALVLRVYEATRMYPSDELHGIRSQLRRAAVSVAAHVVEGARLATGKEFARHLASAIGSASEVEYLIGLSVRLGYLEKDEALSLRADAIEVCRMLHALRARVIQASLAARDDGEVTVPS
ncbi:MAG: four helix bundle protein [Myxococcaceae bacterium]|nr:four helix bundle protein [Myxococcaceae bacterium]